METAMGNKLIAEKFLGWKYQTQKQLWEHSKIAPALCPNGSWTDEKGEGHFELFFHTSWDWLQPAWSKFYVMCETGLRGDEILYNEFADFRDNYNTHANHNNVKAACETLVEAITWYNNTKK